MARISLNIDQETFESTNTDFSPVPAGSYKVNIYEITGGVVGSGGNKGKPRINVQFRIQDGETAPDGSKQGNRRLFAGINCFGGTNKKTGAPTQPFDLIGLAKALGLGADALNDLDTDDWVGEELQVTITHEEQMTKESGYTEPFVPPKYREQVKSYKSLNAVNTAATASASVNAKAGAKKYSLA